MSKVICERGIVCVLCLDILAFEINSITKLDSLTVISDTTTFSANFTLHAEKIKITKDSIFESTKEGRYQRHCTTESTHEGISRKE